MDIEQNTKTKPLVTFVVLTYNQIDFIEDGIKGAASQNYPNLEIIISDDCSTDGTFERVKKIVSNYKGKHTIRLNQTSKNKCILGHFFDLIDLAKGELLVLSAGDDISKPNRVTETVKAWQEKSAVGIFSNYERIDERGISSNSVYSPNNKSKLLATVFKDEDGVDIHGASSAYDMNFLKSLPRVGGRFFFEDVFMSFMINLFDEKLVKIDEPLVLYRSHSGSISNAQSKNPSLSSVREAEKRSSYYTGNQANLFVSLRNIAINIPHGKINDTFDLKSFDDYIDKLKVHSSWAELSPYKRITYLYKYYEDKEFRKWIIPRLFGLNNFLALKAIQMKIK